MPQPRKSGQQKIQLRIGEYPFLIESFLYKGKLALIYGQKMSVILKNQFEYYFKVLS